ncbi:putative calcium ion-binding protein [Senna tora]|uniref:Putative calcium ion-binding protein n=1 Tax=Senna tora TaxID=362788 RepID=A0A835CLZ8_9FABA|nr:putative calcium ion-binding protein [Senna tora]
MGMLMSMMAGKGLSQKQLLSALVGVLYKQFVDKEIKNFEDFHVVILDIFNAINMSMPGKHYDPPSRQEIEVNSLTLP